MTLQQPRPIALSDVVAGFDSGEESLDRYLVERALTNHARGFARCYVSVDGESDRVVGYYTLSAVAVEHAELAGRVRRNALNPVPAVFLGRLAIDRRWQGWGLGLSLLRDALLSAVAAADYIGVRILLVHALHSEAAAFYRRADFMPSPSNSLHLYVLLDDIRASLAAE